MNLKDEKVAVCGAGGFIGGHLVKALQDQGVDVIRAIDIKPLDEWYQHSEGVENLSLDLKAIENCHKAAKGATAVIQLAADMGGMGFIENNKALCMLSVLTNTHSAATSSARPTCTWYTIVKSLRCKAPWPSSSTVIATPITEPI